MEIPIEDPSHIDPAHVKRELDKDGLVCGAVCACMGPDRDLRGTPRRAEDGHGLMKAIIDQMVVLGGPTVIGPVYGGGPADAVEPRRNTRSSGRRVVKHLKEIAKYAEKKGVQICIEPLNRFETDFINTVRPGLKMIEDVGSPGAQASPRHVPHEHRGEEPGEAIRKAGKLLGALPRVRQRPRHAGQRSHRLEADRQGAQGIKYKGDVVIESFTTDVKVIARAAAIWRRMEPTRDEIATKGIKFLKKTLK